MSNSVSHDITNNKGISMSTGKIPMSEDEQTSFADTTVNASNNAPELHNKPDLTHNDLPASASQEMNNPQHETELDTKTQNTSADTTHATSFENEPSDHSANNDVSGSEQQNAHGKPSRRYIRLKNTTAAELSQLESGRKLISFTRVAAPVSLLIGGVLLSGISLICAIISYLKITKVLKRHRELDLDDYRLFIRPVKIALLMAVLALIINAAFLYVEYPRILEAVETGQMSALFNSGTVTNTVSPGTQAAPQPGSTTWG